MKKTLLFCMACGLAMSLLLSGCVPMIMVSGSMTDEPPVSEADEDDAWDEQDDDWDKKGHYWQVLDADGKEVCAVTDEADVQAMDDLTDGGIEWKRVDVPEDAKVLYTYVFMQQKTLLAGQGPDAEREYEEVMRFMVYEDSDVLTMVILDGMDDTLPASLSELIDLEDILTIHAEAPAKTVEALRDPQQFTK